MNLWKSQKSMLQLHFSRKEWGKQEFWSKNPPSRTQTRSFNILRQGPGPVRGSRIATLRVAFEFLITCDVIAEVIQCTNLEGRRVAAARGKDWKKLTMRNLWLLLD